MKKDIFDEARQFIKEFDNGKTNEIDFYWNFSKPMEKDVMIDFFDKEVSTFDVEQSNVGKSNFNDDIGREVNMTNFSCRPEGIEKCRFFDRFFKVVHSSHDRLVVKATDNLYVFIPRDMVFEWK